MDESLRSWLNDDVQFKLTIPSHMRLYNSFVEWYRTMRKTYDEDLILNMLLDAETEIRYGEI